MFEKIHELIKKYEKIIIHRHLNPDGDAIGSQVGLKHLILENYPNKTVLCVGDAPKRYAFMEDSAPDEVRDIEFEDALSIILDTSAPELIADDRYKKAAETARIDHHIFLSQIAKHEVVNTSYESCCGLIAELAIEQDLKLNKTAAKSLYTGLLTDSGRFRYDSTDKDTFRRASFLMAQKFDTNEIFASLYADELESIQLRAAFTLKIKVTEKRVGYIYTTLEEFKGTGKDSFAISRGMVGTMSDIKGIDIWVNFTETDPKTVLCEIRSSKYNINPIAVKYGGGGHAKASGATLHSREEAMHLLADLEDLIGE